MNSTTFWKNSTDHSTIDSTNVTDLTDMTDLTALWMNSTLLDIRFPVKLDKSSPVVVHDTFSGHMGSLASAKSHRIDDV